jgi:hypothetical protein
MASGLWFIKISPGVGCDPHDLTTITISRGLLAEKPGIFRRFSEAG